MNSLFQSASIPLLAFLIQATIVAGLALLTARIMSNRGAAFRIAVYRAAVLSILALLLVGPAVRCIVRPIVELGSLDPKMLAAEPTLVLPQFADHGRSSPVSAVGSTAARQPEATSGVGLAQRPAGPASDPVDPGQIFMPVYLAGVAVVSLGIFAGAAWLIRLRSSSSPYGDAPFTVTSPRIKSAFTAGAIRPTIYLPADIDKTYSLELVQAILRHEHMHVVQHDCLWTLISRLTCAVTWICPLSWVLARRMKEDSELLCDQLVLDSGMEPAGYAGCLLKIAESFVSSPAERYVGAGVVTAKSQLSKRISLMLNSKSNSSASVSRAGRLKIASAFVLTLFVATAVISAAPLARTGHDETPEATLRAFYSAMNKQDFENVFSRIEGAKMDVILPELRTIPRTAHSSAAVVRPHFSNVSINGDTATVTVQLETTMRGAQPREDVATLHKVNGDWKIASGKDVHGMLEQVVEAARDPAKLKKARLAAKKTMVLSNFKQLALGMLMYINDYDDKYSLTQAKLHSALKAYTRNDALWLDADQKPMDVRLNPWLIGKSESQIAEPAYTVMLSLGPKGHLQEIYGMTPVAFCDGHVKFMTLEQAAQLRWK